MGKEMLMKSWGRQEAKQILRGIGIMSESPDQESPQIEHPRTVIQF